MKKNYLFILFLIAAIACNKNQGNNDLLEPEESDSEEVIEEVFEPEESDDSDTYSSEAVTSIVSIVGGGLTSQASSDNNCDSYKYANFRTIGTGGEGFTITLSQPDTITGVKVTFRKSGVVDSTSISASNLIKLPNGTWSIDVSSSTDTFKTCKAKFEVLFKNGKKKSKSVPLIGVDENGKMFGRNDWGLSYEKKLMGITNNGANSIAIDSANFVPVKGDIIEFEKADGNTYKGIIITDPAVTPRTSPKGEKYVFRTATWNARSCKNSRVLKRHTVYRNPAGLLKFVGPDQSKAKTIKR